MSKLVVMRGLPASGKSTYAKTLVDKGYTRVNKDDLRAMLHNSKWSRQNEAFILRVRDDIVFAALAAGKDVVVDDTNLAPKHVETLTKIGNHFKADVTVKTIEVPLNECIKRDLARPNSVGSKVIRRMYYDYILPRMDKYEPPVGKPRAILCDIDGTVAHAADRDIYDYSKVATDRPDLTIVDILRTYKERDPELQIVFVSGRDDSCRDVTIDWLAQNAIPATYLYMRKTGDKRDDAVVKREIFADHIAKEFIVQFVLDDRDRVVEMWRSLGLKVLQVENGDF